MKTSKYPMPHVLRLALTVGKKCFDEKVINFTSAKLARLVPRLVADKQLVYEIVLVVLQRNQLTVLKLLRLASFIKFSAEYGDTRLAQALLKLLANISSKNLLRFLNQKDLSVEVRRLLAYTLAQVNELIEIEGVKKIILSESDDIILARLNKIVATTLPHEEAINLYRSQSNDFGFSLVAKEIVKKDLRPLKEMLLYIESMCIHKFDELFKPLLGAYEKKLAEKAKAESVKDLEELLAIVTSEFSKTILVNELAIRIPIHIGKLVSAFVAGTSEFKKGIVDALILRLSAKDIKRLFRNESDVEVRELLAYKVLRSEELAQVEVICRLYKQEKDCDVKQIFGRWLYDKKALSHYDIVKLHGGSFSLDDNIIITGSDETVRSIAKIFGDSSLGNHYTNPERRMLIGHMEYIDVQDLLAILHNPALKKEKFINDELLAAVAAEILKRNP